MISQEPIFTARAELADVRDVGQTPFGHRRVVNILGGTVTGARLTGRVLPGGADWQLVRSDGVAELDARYVLETSDGARIYVMNFGYRHGPADVLRRLAEGKPVEPSLYYMRTTPRFETAAERYTWLNRTICVATGARRAESVELDVFEVR